MKKGFKVFDKDLKCMGFQYEIGKSYKHDGKISLCNAGFHFCEKLIDCFNYYGFEQQNRVCIVTATGRVESGSDKSVTSRIRIIEEISWEKVLTLVNSGSANTGNRNSGDMNPGNWNSGDRNSGNRNSGDRNSGDWNSGYWNSGDRNSGNMNSGDRNSGNMNSGYWNSGDRNSGYFNSKENNIFIFNKDSGLTKRAFFQKYSIPCCLYFDITVWVSTSEMIENEKTDYPEHVTDGGYLKKLDYKESASASISRASETDRALIRSLPNYDADVFEEIFGIRI